ncbi:hypothetical protein [Ruminococcus flavefaciens]|uniref:hypothetical protein n=1 Tax=Ruminococcus flavefaciens TaxID=1265 RepID=UPI0002DAA0E6|nr:hypothetical protein [Ruminococcus flavefaciens]
MLLSAPSSLIIPEMILLNYYTYFSGIVKLYRKKRRPQKPYNHIKGFAAECVKVITDLCTNTSLRANDA